MRKIGIFICWFILINTSKGSSLSFAGSTLNYTTNGILVSAPGPDISQIHCNTFTPQAGNLNNSYAVHIASTGRLSSSIGGDGGSGNEQPSGNVWPVGNRAAGPISGWSSPSNWYSVYNESGNTINFYPYDNEYISNTYGSISIFPYHIINAVNATTSTPTLGCNCTQVCSFLPSYVFGPTRLAAPDTNNSTTGIVNKKDKILLGECVPNPAENETRIAYRIPENTLNAQITIFEAGSGKELVRLMLDKNGQELIIPTHLLNAGLYLIKLNLDGGNVAMRKLVIVK